jgi:hypothetical protein
MSVFKQLTSSDVTILPFRLHKSKELNTDNVILKYARLRIYTPISKDPLTAKNIIDLNENNILYNQINHLYYNESYDPFYDTFGKKSPQETERKLFGEINIISISKHSYGYAIKPGTLNISGSFNNNTITLEIKDDSKGNIYDASFNKEEFISNEKRVLYLDFRNQIDKIDEFKQA